jgi:RNA polymerase sigma factor (sigma-70 family)
VFGCRVSEAKVSAVLKPNDLLLAALELEPLLRALLWRYTRNPADVEELLQDVYAKLLTAQPRHSINLRGYIFTATTNTAREWLSHRKCVCIELVADVSALEHLDEHALVDELISSQQQLELFAQALKRLTPRRREVILLRKVYGYSQRQIAHRLNISENTVEQLLAAAVRSLALILGSRLP